MAEAPPGQPPGGPVHCATAPGAEQARLDLILEQVPLGLWEWDLATGAVQASPRWFERLGCAPGSAPTTMAGWVEMVHADDRAANHTVTRAFITGGGHGTYALEYRVRVPGGWRWIQSRGSVAERDPRGRVRRIVGVHLDIHEQRMAERSLRENEARLELILHGSEVGTYEWDVLSGSHTIDARWAAMLGYRVEDLPPHIDTWRNLLHPEELAGIERKLAGVMRGDTDHYEHETRLRAKDGHWVWVLDRGRISARDAVGRPLRAAGIHLDITERKQAEAALAASEARLRTLVEGSPIGIFLASGDGTIHYINPTIQRLLGTTAEVADGRAWLSLVHAADRGRVGAAWDAFVVGDAAVFELEYRLVRPRERPVRVRVARVDDGRGALSFVGTLSDLSAERARDAEHERLRRQLQQAQKMDVIGQLAGGVAHDFNNILASVLGFTSLALDRYGDRVDGKLAEYLGAVITAGERGRDLVAKMLAFSRSAPASAPSRVAAAEVVREIAGMLGALLPSSIHLELVLPADLPPVQADPVDLHQVLLNLALNARDAIVERGRLRIGLALEPAAQGICDACHAAYAGPFVVLSVTDDGPGIEPAARSRVFDPFYTTKPVGKGTGLGLSVVHGVMHKSGGHIRLASSAGGTTFDLLFRPAVDTGTGAEGRAAALSPAACAGLRVLLADDEPLMRTYLEELLTGAGATVTVAHDGLEAWTRFEQAPAHFDAVISDQTMPGLSGIELLERIGVASPAVTRLLSSGYSERIEPQRLAERGIHFLPKPIDPRRLFDLLAASPRPDGRSDRVA